MSYEAIVRLSRKDLKDFGLEKQRRKRPCTSRTGDKLLKTHPIGFLLLSLHIKVILSLSSLKRKVFEHSNQKGERAN